METRNNRSTRPMELNQSDPRIDSPEIKVIYPTQEPVNAFSDAKNIEPLEVVPNDPQIIEANPQVAHVCTVSLQEALKQHLFPLILGGLVMLIVGYLIGKK